MAQTPPYAWLNGAVVPWDECVLHARAPGAFWGANVFEGVRAYRSVDGSELNIFRLDDQGKVVEHWDVVQRVPATSANGNTMF